jgi:hypothetical protein
LNLGQAPGQSFTPGRKGASAVDDADEEAADDADGTQMTS